MSDSFQSTPEEPLSEERHKRAMVIADLRALNSPYRKVSALRKFHNAAADLIEALDRELAACDADWRRRGEIIREQREQLKALPSETLDRMPTDAVIAAICKWMTWDYGDKAMRAEASELYHVIQNAAPQDAVSASAALPGHARTVAPNPAVAAPHSQQFDKRETLGDAAEAFVQDLVKREKYDLPAENGASWGYLWHGWALRDAFYAGARWAENLASIPSARTPVADLCIHVEARCGRGLLLPRQSRRPDRQVASDRNESKRKSRRGVRRQDTR